MSVVSVARLDGGARQLHGVERVAALLLAMGQPVAGRVLKHLDPDELRQVTRATAALGSVSAATIDMLIEDFAGHFSGGPDLLGAASEAKTSMAAAPSWRWGCGAMSARDARCKPRAGTSADSNGVQRTVKAGGRRGERRS